MVALTLADRDGGLLPSWTPGAHIDVRLPSGAAGSIHCAVRQGGVPTTASPCAGSPTAEAVR
ncbi:putative phthalate 4,5-dioxygenase domain protein [Mycobacterium kansasii]|uniref:Putative phthalate 4,5-dioxygenase domain protein n=1 Tax=Mycobacterium kansasii TaxID=1768 RepID=A0A1V3XWD5_MYCKA|nr:putative phthalate 4,5-dioxygenase domain protein [Mycobacterium kansasii]